MLTEQYIINKRKNLIAASKIFKGNINEIYPATNDRDRENIAFYKEELNCINIELDLINIILEKELGDYNA